MLILMVALGGAMGSVLRYLMTLCSANYLGNVFPYGTLLVNVVGSFLLGLCLAAIQANILLSPYWRPLITVGFLGGLTTFSTFSMDTLQLLMQGDLLKAACNLLLNLALGLLAVYIGYSLISR